MSKKRNDGDQDQTAFNIYYKHEGDANYPYLLALTIQKSLSQLEVTRAMKMLGDWVE
jgi:hypothetical protein